MSDFAIRLENALGQVRWQPATPNGERMCTPRFLHDEFFRFWTTQRGLKPTMFRSKRKAERIARRHWRYVQSQTWKETNDE